MEHWRMNTIRLLLLEDNRILREGIMSFLKKHDGFTVVAAIGKNEDISKKIRSFNPNVMLLDLGLRSHNSLQLVKTTKMNSPETKIIVMDLIPAQEDILEFVRAGVSGFILKDATTEDFLRTIRAVAKGEKMLPTRLASSLFSQIVEGAVTGSRRTSSKLMESIRMTRRERQVIQLISDGMTNKEIGKKL